MEEEKAPKKWWVGKCGKPHYPKTACKECKRIQSKAYRSTPEGREAVRRALRAYYARKMQVKASKAKTKEPLAYRIEQHVTVEGLIKDLQLAQKKMLKHAQLARTYRSLLVRFINCFVKKSSGWHLYEDKLPELQAIREEATDVVKYRIDARGQFWNRPPNPDRRKK